MKTWIAGEVLSATDQNAEFQNIIDNARSLISPLTGTLDMNGNEIILDADGDTSVTASTDDLINFKIGGTDRTSVGTEGFQGQADILLAFQVFGD